jgi:hypothetical protein
MRNSGLTKVTATNANDGKSNAMETHHANGVEI